MRTQLLSRIPSISPAPTPRICVLAYIYAVAVPVAVNCRIDCGAVDTVLTGLKLKLRAGA